MSIQEAELQIKELQAKLILEEDPQTILDYQTTLSELQKETYQNLDASDRLYLARHPHRPKARQYIDHLFDNFFELHGDRSFRDDTALLAGLAKFNSIPVTILAQNKGNSIQEKVSNNFGMMHPEGYRKAIRLAKQAEKFNRPIITLIDTAGAYPGQEAEARGQAQAIAECLVTFCTLSVPIISIVIGEGGSGGALALSVGDKLLMLENSVYSILSPEGFASILYKDETKVNEVIPKMKMTAQDLLELKFIDDIIKEPIVGIQNDFEFVIERLKNQLSLDLNQLMKIRPHKLVSQRMQRIRKWGVQL